MSILGFLTGKPHSITSIIRDAKKLNLLINIVIIANGPYIDRHERKGIACSVIYSLDPENKVLKTLDPGFGFKINISKQEGLNVDISNREIQLLCSKMIEKAHHESLRYIEFIAENGVKFNIHKKTNLLSTK